MDIYFGKHPSLAKSTDVPEGSIFSQSKRKQYDHSPFQRIESVVSHNNITGTWKMKNIKKFRVADEQQGTQQEPQNATLSVKIREALWFSFMEHLQNIFPPQPP